MDKVILPFLFITVASGLFFSYIRPGLDAIDAIKSEEAALDQALTQSRGLAERRQALLSTYTDFNDEDLVRLEKILPDKLDVVRLVVELDHIAANNRLTIASFDLPGPNDSAKRGASSDDADATSVNKAEVSVKMQGTYANFKRFLYEVESNVTLSDVVSLAIDTEKPALQRAQEVVSLDPTYDVKLQIYWLK